MILASQSPRRRELLEDAGFELTIIPAQIDESRVPGETPVELVGRLAAEKAEAVRASLGAGVRDDLLVAADTIVWMGDEALGKPSDASDATAMLHELSGRTPSYLRFFLQEANKVYNNLQHKLYSHNLFYVMVECFTYILEYRLLIDKITNNTINFLITFII